MFRPVEEGARLAVRLGITGAGQVAQFHSRAIGAVGASVVAVADPDEECGRRLAARIGTKYLSSPDDLRKDPCVPAAVIAIPNATPDQFALAAIQAGKDVLCEKPMTTNPTDSAWLVQAVLARPGIVFQVGYMKRFTPGPQLLREMLPRIGEPRYADVRVLAEHRRTPVEICRRCS